MRQTFGSTDYTAMNDGYFTHESACIDADVTVGHGTRIWHFSHIMSDSVVGRGCNIGQNVVIGPHVSIGNGCKIQNNVSICQGVTLEDDVFCGPSMVFTHVWNPMRICCKANQSLTTLIRRGATLGANCTVVCGLTVGQYAFVGAGAVVTQDVPDYTLVYGNPARAHGFVCACGEKLTAGLTCSACGQRYALCHERLQAAT